jgi:hypothetical protein
MRQHLSNSQMRYRRLAEEVLVDAR